LGKVYEKDRHENPLSLLPLGREKKGGGKKHVFHTQRKRKEAIYTRFLLVQKKSGFFFSFFSPKLSKAERERGTPTHPQCTT